MVEKKKRKTKEMKGENRRSIYSQFSWTEIVGAKNILFLGVMFFFSCDTNKNQIFPSRSFPPLR
jgi:hypothetical protein